MKSKVTLASVLLRHPRYHIVPYRDGRVDLNRGRDVMAEGISRYDAEHLLSDRNTLLRELWVALNDSPADDEEAK